MGSNMRITFDTLKYDYEKIRNKFYKEMEIENVQNKIHLKLYGTKKFNTIYFEKVNDKDEFYQNEKIEKKDPESDNALTILSSEEENEESDIVDFENIDDEVEDDPDI